ncbi:transposase [Nocardia amamiensis]|uniref:transposase n=1 Tax=Nocardia amamiensis TaxID=404578 RepID=UPI0033DFCE00
MGPGDPDIWIVADVGYDAPRLAFLLADLPVAVLARMRSDRVLRLRAPTWQPGTTGRPPRHGGEFVFGDPATWGEPDTAVTTETRLYGPATARSWNRLRPGLTHRSSWTGQAGKLPVLEGTVIRSTSTGSPAAPPRNRCSCGIRSSISTPPRSRCCGRHCCGGSISSTPSACSNKPPAGTSQTPRPRRRGPVDLVPLAAYIQLRLARDTIDIQRPWEKPAAPQRLTPARVRRGFRHLRRNAACPASAPKPSRPGPGRPPATTTSVRHPATRCTSRPPVTRNHPNPPGHDPAEKDKTQLRG